MLVHQQEESLGGIQLQAAPDYFDQFTHVDMVWDKELGLVQHWQLFLPFIAFNDDRDFVWMLLSDLLYFFATIREGAALLEGPVRGHGGGQAVVARAANGRSAVRVSGDVEELPGGAGRYRAFLRRHRRGRARPAAAGA